MMTTTMNGDYVKFGVGVERSSLVQPPDLPDVQDQRHHPLHRHRAHTTG